MQITPPRKFQRIRYVLLLKQQVGFEAGTLVNYVLGHLSLYGSAVPYKADNSSDSRTGLWYVCLLLSPVVLRVTDLAAPGVPRRLLLRSLAETGDDQQRSFQRFQAEDRLGAINRLFLSSLPSLTR